MKPGGTLVFSVCYEALVFSSGACGVILWGIRSKNTYRQVLLHANSFFFFVVLL